MFTSGWAADVAPIPGGEGVHVRDTPPRVCLARWWLIGLVALAGLVVSACTVRYIYEPPPLNSGMTEEQVTRLWGEPAHITTFANESVWTYRTPSRATKFGPYVVLVFLNGRLLSMPDHPASLDLGGSAGPSPRR